jgi:hypothetical protein
VTHVSARARIRAHGYEGHKIRAKSRKREKQSLLQFNPESIFLKYYFAQLRRNLAIKAKLMTKIFKKKSSPMMVK